MQDASAKILATLSERGYRVTNARKSIVKTLTMQAQPIATKALAALIKSDETSVYRTIRMLVTEGLIEEISPLGETARYAVVCNHEHHHHAVCNECGFVTHVPCVVSTIDKKLPRGFKEIHSHEITLYGLCKKCA